MWISRSYLARASSTPRTLSSIRREGWKEGGDGRAVGWAEEREIENTILKIK